MYGSFIPISFITLINPEWPTAPPTSSFPSSFNGKSITGFATYPFTTGKLFATVTIIPIGPFPFIWIVSLSFSFFISFPINAVIVNNLPNAAVVTGLKSCIFLAFSTNSVVLAHITDIFPLYAKHFIILSFMLISHSFPKKYKPENWCLLAYSIFIIVEHMVIQQYV